MTLSEAITNALNLLLSPIPNTRLYVLTKLVSNVFRLNIDTVLNPLSTTSFFKDLPEK